MKPTTKTTTSDRNWIAQNAGKWKPKTTALEERRKRIGQEMLADVLKDYFEFLRSRIRISREAFADEFHKGGLARITELVRTFEHDPDAGLTRTPDPATTKAQQKEMRTLAAE